MHNSIPEDITSLDIESIDFNNKDTLKTLLLKFLDTIRAVSSNQPPAIRGASAIDG